MDGAKLAFRFKFKSHNVEDIKDNYIGSRAYKAVFFILDIEGIHHNKINIYNM